MEKIESGTVLDYLKKRQSELEKISHPMAKNKGPFRFLYCFGLGVMALGNMKAITELQDYFDTLIGSMFLSVKERNLIIIDINNYFDFRMNECLGAIRGKECQYCFVLDLYKIYKLSLWSQDYCESVLDYYLQIFHFSLAERNFFESFSEAAEKKDISMAIECYNRFRDEGYDIRYSILSYFFPEFLLEEQYDNITIASGETLILDKPTIINGDIVVQRGGSLLINGGIIKMTGHISTYGGRIRLKEARVKVLQNSCDYWLELHDTAAVQIEDSYVDCNRCCGFLYQDAGRLIITGSEIYNTSVKRAISFWGMSGIITESDITNNDDGAIDIHKAARMIIKQCRFIDCKADYGGAIQSETIANVKFENCTFERCLAKYLGAAVYFKYQKFGQFLTACTCIDCQPEESQIFNIYEDDFEMKML